MHATIADSTESAESADSYTIAKPRILVVEDSTTMRKAIRRLLSNDFEVVEADDGDTGWELVRDDPSIQVVFSDLMMPRMNGFMLLRQIRESIHSRISELPVIIITGHEDDEKMRRQAMALGATDFITKPFDSLQLRARAKAHAKFEHTQRRLQQATQALEQRSTIDPLTGLANANYFREHGPVLLSFAIRHGNELSVLRIDVDQYDELFRKRGRQVADKVLVNISKIITGSVRREDTVARVGLSKFAVLMPGANEQVAREVASKIHDLNQKAGYRLGNTRFAMTVSAGLVTPALYENLQFDEVIKLAEARVAKAMASGGNTVVFEEGPPAESRAAPEGRRVALSVEEALILLRTGDTAKVNEQLGPLLRRMFPLLVHANRQLRLGMDGALLQLKNRAKEL
ncbi:response regulator [Thioalkalivibrio sulfidiphilus]|uniref:GGDEF domain-containing response regulator n=1 Tax=Thioalkalivibrio sulfidiphilus TaxID=1033854 RepID=UPI000375ECBB|nr:response regulator [Thioalkalivibrio sulfidiphilus]